MAAATPFCAFHMDGWPMVDITLGRAPVANEEIDAFQTDFCGLLVLARDGNAAAGVAPAALYINMCLDGIVDATMEQKFRAASFIRDVKPLVEAGALAATAVVVTQDAARSVVQFILSLAPLTSRHAIFSTDAEARAWLRGVASEHEARYA
jgi:hypothetical protein